MSRKIEISKGEYYHVYNRGTDKKRIFPNDVDKKRFLSLLYLCNSSTALNYRDYKGLAFTKIFKIDLNTQMVDVGAYCVMDNHFHLLLHEKISGGISSFMQKLCTSYSMYFNTKYERKGTLFEGPFQYKQANSDEYLKYLFSYIHLNPIEYVDKDWKIKGIKNINQTKEFLANYFASSYMDYLNLNFDRSQKQILNTKAFPKYFESIKDLEETIRNWLEYRSDIDGLS